MVTTVFDGNKVVFDAMVIINFHGCRAFESLLDWAPGEIIVPTQVQQEAPESDDGLINWNTYITTGAVAVEDIEGAGAENIFYQYYENTIAGKTVHEGEAACLALAISQGYGLACDESVIRDEFSRCCPEKICVSSWMIVNKAVEKGLIDSDEADGLKKGFFYL